MLWFSCDVIGHIVYRLIIQSIWVLFPQGMVQPATFPTRNLNGCIRDLQLGVSSFDLVRDFIVAENVENCFIAACDNVDCNGQGTCVELVRMLA